MNAIRWDHGSTRMLRAKARPEAERPVRAVNAFQESRSLQRLDWRVLLLRAAPTVASCVLAALLGSELAVIALALLPRKSPAVSTEVSSPARAASGGLDAGLIVTAHLFGLVQENQIPELAPASKADLKLTGTLATADPRHGMAIVGDQGRSEVYSVGESLDGASLREVYPDHVILERNGSFESLSLPREPRIQT